MKRKPKDIWSEIKWYYGKRIVLVVLIIFALGFVAGKACQ